MEKQLSDLPLSLLEDRITTQIHNLQDELEIQISISAIYINGSFGAGDASEDSDIDVTIGLLQTPDVKEVHPDTWIKLSRKLCREIESVDGHSVDVQVYPRNETDFVRHIQERSRYGGYNTVYRLGSREFVSVTNVQ